MAERYEIVEKALRRMLEEKKYQALKDLLVVMNPADVAALFQTLEEEKIPLLFRLLPKELAAETFVEMEPEEQELLIQGVSSSTPTRRCASPSTKYSDTRSTPPGP